MDTRIINHPTLKDLKQIESDKRTRTTGTKRTNGTDLLSAVALLALIIYLSVGIMIGMVVVWSLSFPLQLVAMGSYLVLGGLGFLPWQIDRK